MLIDYTLAKECKNEDVWYTCYGGFWCKEDCKLLQLNDAKQVEKVLSTGGVVYILYADGTWRKNEK